jgi:hypothetical protein
MARPDGKVEKRDENSDLGGTMRLGAQTCAIKPGTLASEIYGAVTERHRHRYEANNHYLPRVEAAGLVVAARTPTEDLCEIMELPRGDSTRGSWACSSTRNSNPPRVTATRCSRLTSRRRWPTRLQRARELQGEAA